MAAAGRNPRLLARLSVVAVLGTILSLVGASPQLSTMALGNLTFGACCLNGSCSLLGKVPCMQMNGTFSVNESCSVCATPTATSTQTQTATATATATNTATATATASASATPTETQVPQGGSCMTAGECQTGFCADGVCCDQACDGQGESCNAAGVCVVPAGAPAASMPGLALAVVMLSAIAGLALLRPRRSSPPRR